MLKTRGHPNLPHGFVDSGLDSSLPAEATEDYNDECLLPSFSTPQNSPASDPVPERLRSEAFPPIDLYQSIQFLVFWASLNAKRTGYHTIDMSSRHAADIFPSIFPLEGRDLESVSREEIIKSIEYAPRIQGSDRTQASPCYELCYSEMGSQHPSFRGTQHAIYRSAY
jgi:hypothetical protein